MMMMLGLIRNGVLKYPLNSFTAFCLLDCCNRDYSIFFRLNDNRFAMSEIYFVKAIIAVRGYCD
jgi:hypothetical protein